MSSVNSPEAVTVDSDPSILAQHPGLTTKDALNSLYRDILLFKYEVSHKETNRSFHTRVLKSSFERSSYYTTFSWVPISILLVIITALTIFTSSQFPKIIIAFLLIVNVVIVYWDNHLRFNEFKNRIDYVLRTLKKVKKKNNWQTDQFPNLYTPHSPSVSLQWTIRDGQLINLPSVLLAKGDIIVMRPGHVSPAEVETVLPPPSQDNKYSVLVTDQLLDSEPSIQTVGAVQSETLRTVERPPVQDRLYEVTKAPYIAQLKAISSKYLERPTSLYDKARYLLFGKCLHHVILPVCFVICEILATVRWYILPLLHCPSCTKMERWTYFFVIETTSVLIPLISLAFTVFWFTSNAIGNSLVLSRFSSLEDDIEKYKKKEKDLKKSDSFYYDDLEVSLKTEHPFKKTRQRANFWRFLMNFVRNNGAIIVRCSNFLHTMASVTVLCCVDKKGVLSFPNPIAEKVFFLKNRMNKYSPFKSANVNNEDRRTIACKEDSNGQVYKVTEDNQSEKSSKPITTQIEILDITPRNERGSAWKIEFDDSHWRYHLSSLKPIGLAILLNTCNHETHKSYNHFCSHITSHALQNKHLVPVANRRCLCELARQIGFHEDSILDKYRLEVQLFTYKNLAETQAGNKYVQAFFKTRKPKFPFPHAMSVIVSIDNRNSKSRSNTLRKDKKDEDRKRKRLSRDQKDSQMFSQGTADVILDYCVDYWDGCNVYPLTPSIRKKILDFYQRSSLTAYCSAFSYKPIYKNFRFVSKNSGSAVYIELLNSIESRQRQRRRRRRRQRRCDSKAEEDCIIRLQNEISPRRNVSLGRGFYFRDKQEPVAVLQEVTECDEETEENTLDNVHDYDEDIDPCVDEYDDVLEYDDYSEETEDDDEDDDEDEDKENNSEKQSDQEAGRNHSAPELDTNYFQILGKQIFLGMVSMQYQPLVDMVQMIEELEKACIRFVHFSKENELRSRVFSEKMGLESGWNCHISLLPDADVIQLVDGYGANEGISVNTDHEISSTVETGASSADDEENVPFAFDMSNRAKLPCGIRNIKPHLEQVDNVPLLVSLFTDCTSDTTEQMLAIIQEYGQVVCVLGSSANIKNFSLFAQADASISVEPLYAQVCQQIPSPMSSEKNRETKCPSPTELSHLLNSLPCSLILQRNYNYNRILPICPIIAESRNLMRLIWNCCQFWLSCIALIFTIQVVTLLFFLPAIFTLEQALWISVIITPCLSISLATAPHDVDIMNKTKGKDWLCSVNWTTIKYAVTCYGTKLLCSVITILTLYIMQLMAICNCLNDWYVSQSSSSSNSSMPAPLANRKHCIYIFFLVDSTDEKMESDYIDTLIIIQYHMTLVLSLHLVALCLSFLHRDTVCWKKIPRFNAVWLLFILLPLSVQVVHFVWLVNYWSTDCMLNSILLFSVRNAILTFLSPCLTYLVSEIVKIHEISINERYQKKVRLEFGTKLGMNSPF